MDRRSLFFIYHMKIKEIIAELERHAPSSLQESYDNTGYQCGDPEAEATGALLCMDVTEEIVREAQEHGLNLIVSHHPLLFRGVKAVIGRNRPERALAEAIRRGVTVYSSHTAMDSTRGGVCARGDSRRGAGVCHRRREAQPVSRPCARYLADRCGPFRDRRVYKADFFRRYKRKIS